MAKAGLLDRASLVRAGVILVLLPALVLVLPYWVSIGAAQASVLRLASFAAATGLLVQWFCNAWDFPLNVGSRPPFSLPAFIPITFEMMVLFASIAAFVAALQRGQLPRLAPGVWVHFHDVTYPGQYPLAWLRNGCAWNEVIFIQTLLVGGRRFQVEWFNAYAGRVLHEKLAPLHPTRARWGGGSLWLRTSES